MKHFDPTNQTLDKILQKHEVDLNIKIEEEKNTKEITVRSAINIALKEILTTKPTSYIIGEEVSRGGACGVTSGLIKLFPTQIFDTPISESGFTGLAIGSSYILHPIVDFMTMNFSLQALDQILNSAIRTNFMTNNKLKYNIIFRGPNGFNSGVGAQHTDCLGRIYGSIPDVVVLIPYTANDHYGLLIKAIEYGGPIIFLESELLYEKKFILNKKIKKFESEVINDGNEICFIGIGHALLLIEQVVQKYKNRFLILNLIVIRPLDTRTIFEAVRKCNGNVVIVEYSTPLYSLSSEIGFQILKNVIGSKVEVLCCEDSPTPYSAMLENEFLPNEDKLESIISKFL
ncbi:Pyruvate dehydrogenase E1 component subunit beta-2, mitochondrial [Cucumispora dikerogammari]|nr:Pyruvate dehydrogenase E1 component subunit beta-2, mitochondrial [Cucumispora dikerogammari]